MEIILLKMTNILPTVIDFNYITLVIKREREKTVSSLLQSRTSLQKSGLLPLLKIVLQNLLSKAIRIYKALKNEEIGYFRRKGEIDLFSLDFLLYCLNNKNCKFDLSPFKEEDQKEIIKFVDNKIKLCMCDQIKIDFSDKKHIQLYDQLCKK